VIEMDVRVKIIISLLIITILSVGGLSTALYFKDYNELSEQAAEFGISPNGLTKKEIEEEIKNKKEAIELEKEYNKLKQKAIKYGIEYEGLYYSELKETIKKYEDNRVSIKGRIFSIVSSTDGKSRTWTIIGEYDPLMDYTEAEVIVNAETKIYDAETNELIAFDKIKESQVVAVNFSGIVDDTSTPIIAFAGKVIVE
jgi:hypothetical protein